MGVRLRRGLEGHARAARRQGGERRRDDPRARRRPRPGRVHDHDRGVRRLHALGRGAAGARGAGGRGTQAPGGNRRQEVRGRHGSAVGLGPQRRARVDARDARHDPERGAERPLGARAVERHRQRAVRLGLLPPACADVRQRRRRGARQAVRGRDRRGEEGRGRRDRCGAPGRRAEAARRAVQGLLRLPPGPSSGAAPAGDPGGVRLLDGRARGLLPADQPDSRRLGDRGQRPADGVRQQGRGLGHRGRVQPRRGHRRARALGRLSRQRPGRGRRLRRPHPARHLRAGRGDARGARAADGDHANARGAVQGHAGRRVHGRVGTAVHASDPQRQAPGPGGGAVRGRCRRRGATHARGRAPHDRRLCVGCAASPDLRPRRRLQRARPRGGGLAGRGRRRDRVQRAGRDIGGGGGKGCDPGAAVHRGRRRGRLPCRHGDPHLAGRQGFARGARSPRDGRAGGDRRGGRGRPRAGRAHGSTDRCSRPAT